MNLQQIKYFIELANAKNFTRASEQMYVVQSTFSAGIKKLENHLGVRLFDRDKRNVSLTSAGEMLYPKAIELMNHWYEIEESFKVRSSLEIKLGFEQNLDVNTILPFINEFKRQNVLSDVKMEEDKFDLLLKKLDTNSIHAFFAEDRVIDKSVYQKFNITSEELFFALNRNHPLAKKEALSLSVLHNEPFIDRSYCALYQEVYKELNKQDIVPRKVFSAHNNETVGALITSSMGITLMPKPFFNMPEVKFISIKDVELSRKIILISKNINTSKVIKNFVNIVKEKNK